MNKKVDEDLIRLKSSIIIGGLLVVLLWFVKVFEWITGIDLYFLGIYPRVPAGMVGILTAPLIHADAAHVAANSVPLFVTSAVIFYFYREVFWAVFWLVWIVTGIWVWSFAREAWHIGASGIVYGYISFLFFSGVFRRHARLMAVSFLMVFLYGGLFWGIFPDFYPDRHISWESHLMGGLAGLMMAFFFRRSGLQKEVKVWDDDEDDGGLPWQQGGTEEHNPGSGA